MSIYGTLWTMLLPVTTEPLPAEAGVGPEASYQDTYAEVTAQRVGGHIRNRGRSWSWLPKPPRDEEATRAVVFVGPYTTKGTSRCPQEYNHPLLIVNGEEYEAFKWDELMQIIQKKLERHILVHRREKLDKGGLPPVRLLLFHRHYKTTAKKEDLK